MYIFCTFANFSKLVHDYGSEPCPSIRQKNTFEDVNLKFTQVTVMVLSALMGQENLLSWKSYQVKFPPIEAQVSMEPEKRMAVLRQTIRNSMNILS